MIKIHGSPRITPFLQVVWVSEQARQTWEPELQRVAAMVQEMEIASVAAGQRPCAWQTIARASLPAFANNCAEQGLVVLPVKFVGSWEGFIHHTPEGDSNIYCIVAQRLTDALAFRMAFERGDHDGQGEMLGFPSCCRQAFAANWAAGDFDPIWQAAEATPGAVRAGDGLHLQAHPYSNPVLRYAGVRVGFHIPCSFQCAETIRAMRARMDLASVRRSDEVTVLEALLRMPMEWTVLHGIATATTPLFRLVTNSVPAARKYAVQIDGDYWPAEGAEPLRKRA